MIAVCVADNFPVVHFGVKSYFKDHSDISIVANIGNFSMLRDILQTKEVDEENKEGFFLIYKRVINRIVSIVNEVNPNYPYAKSLVSTIVEGSLHQHFLTEHLTTITDCNDSVSTTQFYLNLTENVLR